jgi:hypothetical protein
MVVRRLPLFFYALRLLTYDVGNNFPAVINQLHIHVQACANVNVLYRNLQIRVARRSWIHTMTPEEIIKHEPKPKKLTKSQEKEARKKKDMFRMNNRMAYLDILPKSTNFHG